MASGILTPANQITILRLVFVPIFAALVVEREYRWALAVLAAAALSDVLDGNVARIFHQKTSLGAALDPIADKALMTTAFIVLAVRDVLPWWLTIMVISRDVAMMLTALLIILAAGYRTFTPSILGKASTVVQMMTILAAVSHQAEIPLVSDLVVRALIYLAAAFTAVSGVHYLLVVTERYAHKDGN
jgi:cardiolipin synthase (CMP-forming)